MGPGGATGQPGAGRPFRQGIGWSAKGDIEAIISNHLSALQTALSKELQALATEREQRIEDTIAMLQSELEEYRKSETTEAPAVTVEVPPPILRQSFQLQSATVDTIQDSHEPNDEEPEATHQPHHADDGAGRQHGQTQSQRSLQPVIQAAVQGQDDDLLAKQHQTILSVVPEASAPATLPGVPAGLTGSHPLSRMNPSSGCGSRRGSVKSMPTQRKSLTESAHIRRSSMSDGCEFFSPWPSWKEEAKTFHDRILPTRSAAARAESMEVQERSRSTIRLTSFCVSMTGVISPSSPFSCFWNILFMSVLCYELIILPLRIFELPQGGVISYLGLSAVTFWSADLVMSFNVGFFTKSGALVMDRRRIIAKYARSWMIPDTVIVCLDWVLLVSEHVNDMGSFPSLLRIGKALRYVRVLRVLRLLRLRKLRETIHLLDEFVSSEYFSISKNVFLNMIGILVISHFLGCLWFFIGTFQVSGYNSWVQNYHIGDMEWGYQYLTSLHWSLTQITPGSMEIQPQNIPERAFAVMVLILGIIVFSSIVSSITSAVNNLKSIGARYEKQRWALRRFFREQCVSHELASRVTRYADNIIRPQQKKVARAEVELLRLLPASLYNDVMLELFDKLVEVHPLFQALHQQNKAVMQKICCVLETLHFPKDDVLFIPGETAQAMYWVIQGQFRYCLRESDATLVDRGGWFCEMVLWTPWVHQGSMESTCDSELVFLDSRTFQETVSKHRSDMRLLKRYACEFVKGMNDLAGSLECGTASQEQSLRGDGLLSDLMTIESALRILELSERRGSVARPSRKSEQVKELLT